MNIYKENMMTHEISEKIHDFVTQQVATNQTAMETEINAGNENKSQYYKGKLETYLQLRKKMSETMDLDTQNYY